MAVSKKSSDAMPTIRDVNEFDRRSGNVLERLVFNHRLVFLAICAMVTLFLGYKAKDLTVNASFDKMIPQAHPYINNYFKNRDKLGGLGNVVRVVIESKQGDIFQPAFLDTVRKVNDDLFLTPGVDRAWQKSIWMSGVRWMVATEEGFRGGPVMPDDYNGSPASLAKLRTNIDTARLAGSLVSRDYKSVMIVVPLLEKDPATGAAMDYGAFSKGLEKNIREKYSAAGKVDIHIVGFAKMIGDLIDGMIQVLKYFAFAAAVAAGIIYFYTRCPRSTALVLLCSLVAVVWLLGALRLLGFYLDPYSVLVPFLVFAIGVSHAAQKMNGIMQDVGRGTHKYVAARYTFRRLFLAGFTALLADAVGFAVLMVIDIPVIKDLALAASIGVAMLIVTNLLLLPVMLSFVGVGARAARRSMATEAADGQARPGRMIGLIERFTTRRWALGAVLVSSVLLVVGLGISQKLKVGDLDAGAPELRADSRYNRDVAYINANYGLSSDQFVVIVKVPDQMCSDVTVMKKIENLSWKLRGVPGVQSVASLSEAAAYFIAGMQEDNPKWMSIPTSPTMVDAAAQQIITNIPEAVDTACSTIPVSAYLTDHKAETLEGVVAAVEQFAAENDDKTTKFMLAAGPAGIEAVTNIVVHDANRLMLLYVYAAVMVLCFITFRSWRAVAVAVIPLVVTSVLCEALMATLGIGVKVATLPVIALGVGIGVDYALYLLSVQLQYQRAGMPLQAAYRLAMQFTGKVVALIGVTLAAGVVTWAWSPIKFQADMGILLTFMFLWNMVGALIMIPALSYFLLRPKAVQSEDGVSVPAAAAKTERAPERKYGTAK
jgi:uncharacterized protein